jgi:HEAT repeat protein
MAMRRKRLVRIVVWGAVGLLLAFVVMHPYTRQALIGPKVADLPLRYWQDNFRHDANPEANRHTVAARALRWLGFAKDDDLSRGGLPDKTDDRLVVLLSLEGDPQPNVREMVAQRLGGGFSAEDCGPALLRLLDDPDARVRAAAASSLARVKPEVTAALPRLLELLDEPDPDCRLQAAMAIWRVGQKKHREVILVLRQGMKNREHHPMVRYEALRLLGQIGKDAMEVFPDLVACATAESDPAFRSEAAYNLAQFGAPAIPVLITVLRDTDPGTRACAAHGLAHFGPDAKDALGALQALLVDPDEDVRQSVMAALHRIDPEQFPAPKAEPE